ncbi:otoraplin [Protopterus annectens]|uniref:otoraplin n=1 Tax=Protopterus annectens TaxID=7888 RepID=UPI001CFB2DF9|nr:otoraplin [Protopterus annectens]
MGHLTFHIVCLLILASAFHVIYGNFMDKLAQKKLCVDDECSLPISLVKAEEDYTAPDCRFINFKKGQTIYVYSKLVKEKGAGEFWSGSAYNEQQADEVLLYGYFPSNIVNEQHVFQKAEKELLTTVRVTYLFSFIGYDEAHSVKALILLVY